MSKFNKARREAAVEPIDLSGDTAVVPISGDPMTFNLKTVKGLYVDVDLRLYRDGNAKRGINGFPELIADLLPTVRQMIGPCPASPGTVSTWIEFHLLVLFRWLTQLKREVGVAPGCVLDFEDFHGELLKRCILNLGEKLNRRKKQFTAIWSLLTEARGEQASPLNWPSIEIAPQRTIHPDVDPRTVKVLYNTCKRVLDEADKSSRKGLIWLDEGIDPRDVEGTRRIYYKRQGGAARNPAWYSHANLAVLVRKGIRDRIAGSRC